MTFRSFQIQSFDPRLQNQPQGLLTQKSLLTAENALADFIAGLNSQHFQDKISEYPEDSKMALSLDIPEITSKDYFLICTEIDNTGFHYQIFEPIFLHPVAYCIVRKSTMFFPVTETLLDEIKNNLTKSCQDSLCYMIEENKTILSSSPEHSTQDPFSNELVKNISFLGKALDIVKLDPVNLIGSFGEINALDYSFSAETAIPSSDGRYGIPPGTRMEPKFSADVNVSTSIFEEKTSFTDKFSQTVSINIPFPPVLGTFGSSNSKEISVVRKQLFPSYTPKLVEIVKKYKQSAKILINKINFSNIWRNQAKSQILTEGDVRLDLQGMDKNKFNYQLQVGPHTIAAVLIDRPIAEIRIESEKTYAVRKIKSGFQQSLDDCHIYQLSFKTSQIMLENPEDNPKEDPEKDPMDGEEGEKTTKGSAFSCSFTYEFVKENTKESKNTVTHSTITRSLYALKQDIVYDPQSLRIDDEFRFWVEKKLNPDNPQTLQRFIDEVGTHYTTSVTYGGVGFQVLKMSYEAIQQLTEKKISIEMAAADSLLTQNSTIETKNGYSSYDSKTDVKTVFLGGTVMPQIDQENHKLDFKDWAESVVNEPIPLAIKISPLTDLITPNFFPSMDLEFIKKLKDALEITIFNYLKKHLPQPDTVEHQIFTSSLYSSNSRFILEAANTPKTISNPYLDYWSTLPYMFPSLKENSGAEPLVFFFRLGCPSDCQQIIHNTAYTIGSVALRLERYGPGFKDYDSLSFFQGWPQAYFDSPGYTDRAVWIIEKLNTSGDLFIRDGDQIRLKHVSSSEYLATTSLADAHQTLTRTKDKNDSIFIIKKAPVG